MLRKRLTKTVEKYRKKYLTNEGLSDKITFAAEKVAKQNKDQKYRKKCLTIGKRFAKINFAAEKAVLILEN